MPETAKALNDIPDASDCGITSSQKLPGAKAPHLYTDSVDNPKQPRIRCDCTSGGGIGGCASSALILYKNCRDNSKNIDSWRFGPPPLKLQLGVPPDHMTRRPPESKCLSASRLCYHGALDLRVLFAVDHGTSYQ